MAVLPLRLGGAEPLESPGAFLAAVEGFGDRLGQGFVLAEAVELLPLHRGPQERLVRMLGVDIDQQLG